MKKKLMTMMVFTLALICFSGCGKRGGGGSGGSAAASRDYVYKMERLGIATENSSVNALFRTEAGIYARGYNWKENGNGEIVFYEIRDDGTAGKTYSISVGSDESFNYVSMDEDGSVFFLKNVYYDPGSENGAGDWGVEDAAREAGEVSEDAEEEAWTGETEESGDGSEEETEEESGEESEEAKTAEEAAAVDNDTAAEDEYIDDYYLTKMTLDGEELFSVKLNDMPELRKNAGEEEYFYIGDMFLDPGKAVYITVLGRMYRFDLECNFTGEVPLVNGENLLEGVSLISLDDGRVAAVCYEENGLAVGLADLEKGTIGEKYPIPGRSYDFSYYAGIGYDLYLTNSYGLYGYNLGDEDKTQLVSYIDSDFTFYDIYQVTGINDKEFLAICNEWEGLNDVARFSKVEPEDVKEKKVITLAMAYTDWGVRQEVIKYNKASEEYRIDIRDYSVLYGSDEDWEAGISQLNTDIVTGKVPDMMLLNNSMPVDSYISKGLFEDLRPYIEKDSGLDINNFMPNVLEAFSVGEKLYSLVPSYYVNTLAAKTSEVGPERGWTVQQVRELMASKPEDTQFLVNVTRDEMMENCISMAGEQFIDWESGKCSFDSDGFVQMLEFVGTFPEEVNWDALEDEFWNNYDSMWREGKAVATVVNLSEFKGYNTLEKGTFGEKVTLIGFPSADGEGAVIIPNIQFALSAKSGNKEGAWEFLRTFLTDEYQEEISYAFPMSIKRLDEMGKEAMQKSYYMDENNNKVEYDDIFYLGGVDIVIPPMTSQEVEDLKAQLYSFTQAYRRDETLLNIIQEEAAPYYAGQKSAKEAASVIQSRVQIYVNENR